MTTDSSLTHLVHEGAPGGRIVFASGGDASVAVGRLAEAGGALYADTALAPVVAVAMTNDRPTVEVLLGAITSGTTLVSLPLPARATDPASYTAFIRRVCDDYGASEIVARDDIADLAASFGIPARSHAALGSAPLAARNDDNTFRLVQFSSGTTRLPKPIELNDQRIGANVTAVLHVLEPEPGDMVVSWLPLAHDMGLVGMLLTSIAAASPRWVGRGDLVLLEPTDFLRRPSHWLEALSTYQATFTAGPDFGYRMATQRPPTTTVDLSPLRCAIVGGEIIRADTLAAFTDRFGDSGLNPLALCPAYGLAELGVAATMTRPEHHWRQQSLTTTALAEGRIEPPQPHEPALTLVASGQPLPGYEVRTTGGDHTSGTLAVRGPSIGTNRTTGASFADPDGWLHTGDAGFIDDGWLYVSGRTDDYLVTHGRNLYAPAIEAQVSNLDDIRSGRVAAVALPTGEWVIVAEPTHPQALSCRLREDIRRAVVKVAGASPDDIHIVDRGTLPFTPSGKLQRHEVQARLLQERSPGQ